MTTEEVFVDYHRVQVEGPGTKTWLRSSKGPYRYLSEVPHVEPGVFCVEDNYFVLEQALVDGTLPDPSLAWEETGKWIAPYQWDMLIYMWSNADISRTSQSFSGLQAAYIYTGLNRFVRERKEQTRRRDELFAGLERAGLMAVVRTAGRKTYRELKLAPVWLKNGPEPSGIPRTWANLSGSDRKWFKMAMKPFTQPVSKPSAKKKVRCAWAELEHVDKRALAALYMYLNDKEFGAVDPNHLCMRGSELVFSDAFMRAVGRNVDVDVVPQALGEFYRRGLIGFMSASFTEDKPHPGSPSHVRYATSDRSSRDRVVLLKHVPRAADPVSSA